MSKGREFEAFDTAWNGSYDTTKYILDDLVRQMQATRDSLYGDAQRGYEMAINDLVRHFEVMDNARRLSPRRNRILRSYLKTIGPKSSP